MSNVSVFLYLFIYYVLKFSLVNWNGRAIWGELCTGNHWISYNETVVKAMHKGRERGGEF